MKRWSGALAIVLLCCLAIVAIHGHSVRLLQDSDTSVMFARLAARPNPLSWFSTDWPLQNHFYRPITALSFELDRRLFSTPAGFGLSASIYCALTILAVFWAAREFTDSPGISALAAALFAFWHSPFVASLDGVALTFALLLLAAGILRHQYKLRLYLPAVFGVTFLAIEVAGVHLRESPEGFYRGMLAWLPSRTAALATLFSMCALASYVRFERLGAGRASTDPSPTDPPTTKTSPLPARASGDQPWFWLIASVAATALALGSYEQAAMLPFVLLLAGGYLRTQKYAVRWGAHLAFWLLLFTFVAIRARVLPPGMSAYQQQQARQGVSAIFSAVDYFAPGFATLPNWWSALSVGSAVLVTGFFYLFLWRLAANVVTYEVAFAKSRFALFAWLSSCLAFLPMAFLKPFPHYSYWPMALRSLFVAALAGVVWKMIVTALSPQAVKAPRRPVPAPGSLPHP